MGKIKISYDKEGNTLNVWFDDPEKEFVCEETGEEVKSSASRNGTCRKLI